MTVDTTYEKTEPKPGVENKVNTSPGSKPKPSISIAADKKKHITLVIIIVKRKDPIIDPTKLSTVPKESNLSEIRNHDPEIA
jgi:hypothetical protein